MKGTVVVSIVLAALSAMPVSAQTARERYESALAREQDVRGRLAAAQPGATTPSPTVLMTDATRVVSAYEALVRRYPVNGYADNALWQAAGLAETLYRTFARDTDRESALKLYQWLISEYPTSAYVSRARTAIGGLAPSTPAAASQDSPSAATSEPPPPSPAPGAAPASTTRATMLAVSRAILPETVRVTIELDREVSYREERITGPARVFFDLKGVQLTPALLDKVLTYPDDVVKQIRLGRHPDSVVRVVLDQEGVKRYSVFTLYNPFRIVIDSERSIAVAASQPTGAAPTPESAPIGASTAASLPATAPSEVTPTVPPAEPRPAEVRAEPAVPASRDAAPVAPAGAPPPPVAPAAPIARESEPAPPSTNKAGGFSLSRQLGLSVSRIVIDPGHGGRDPGTRAQGLKEADLTLDIALRLEKLLQAEPGLEVVLTRRADEYVPLETRTEIANREGADLFLSIHANASRNPAARGIETYFLSFASSPDAEAVAARENASSERSMHTLPDIIKAIALNNKLDESRDLAAAVQETLSTRLRRADKETRNRGVRKAPFVVLIGAGMPSALTEIAFLSNKQEAQLLKTTAYKQRIAEALHAAVLKYRNSLKKVGQVADR
jgi:N-acetylmuramoyl-L-alanine amidase